MKNIRLICLISITSLLLSFTFLQTNTNLLFVESYEDVGTIKQSILKPESFNKTQKGLWVLLNGRELERNTELYKILEEGHDLNILKDAKKLPDARGKFIRSSNYLGKGSDPDASRLVGSHQNDAFQGHFHKFIGNTIRPKDPNYNSNYLVASGGESSNHPEPKNNVFNNYIGNAKSDDINGTPRIAIETRPININMYTYIKIVK